MKNHVLNSSSSFLILTTLAVLSVFLSYRAPEAKGSAFPGLTTTIATTSNPIVGTTASTLFATSSCSTRIITTYQYPIMLTFNDYAGQTPTALFGHLQAASTTVVYDSGLYGCGLYKVYGYTASMAITVSETR